MGKKKTTATRVAKYAKAGRNRAGQVTVRRKVMRRDRVTGKDVEYTEVCRENLRHGHGSQRAKLWHYTGSPLACLK